MFAFCYASGLIEFGNRVPSGAIVFAKGPPKALRAFVDVHARHGYSTRLVKGRTTKIPGTETLRVPGVPEESDEKVKLDNFRLWLKWISQKPPVGVVTLGDVSDVALPQAAE